MCAPLQCSVLESTSWVRVLRLGEMSFDRRGLSESLDVCTHTLGAVHELRDEADFGGALGAHDHFGLIDTRLNDYRNQSLAVCISDDRRRSCQTRGLGSSSPHARLSFSERGQQTEMPHAAHLHAPNDRSLQFLCVGPLIAYISGSQGQNVPSITSITSASSASKIPSSKVAACQSSPALTTLMKNHHEKM